MKRTTLAMIGWVLALQTFAQGAPTRLEPDPRPLPGPSSPSGSAYSNVPPQPPNAGHFVARTRDLLPLMRSHADERHNLDFRIAGVRIWPATPFDALSFRILDAEAGRFDRVLFEHIQGCKARAVPADSQFIVVDAQLARDAPVPVFFAGDSKGLNYVQLSVDRPGAPVLLVVTSTDGIALRVTASSRTVLAGVRLDSPRQGVVLGVDPALVSQRGVRNRARSIQCPDKSLAPADPGSRDPVLTDENTVRFTMRGNYQFSIGTPQTVRYRPPLLGNFADPEAPVPNQYGLVVLASRGYIRHVPMPELGGQRANTGEAFEILKPFRIPTGLAGAHMVAFVLTSDVEEPSGDLAHSILVRAGR